MSAIRCLTVLIATGLMQLAVAQEPESPPAEPPARPAPPSEADRRAERGADVFIPSEELAADEEATFPVDI